MKKYLPPLLFLIFFHLTGQAQDSTYATAIDSARNLMKQFMQFNSIPGASVSVAIDGRIAWSEGFGYADLEQQVPVRADQTRFRVGSVSKPFTAAALGRLYDLEKIKLDTPIQAYVPAFPEKRWPITLRQLGGHLAGIRHYRDGEFMSNERYESVEQGLRIFAGDTLLFEPGTRYAYTSYGWNLRQ